MFCINHVYIALFGTSSLFGLECNRYRIGFIYLKRERERKELCRFLAFTLLYYSVNSYTRLQRISDYFAFYFILKYPIAAINIAENPQLNRKNKSKYRLLNSYFPNLIHKQIPLKTKRIVIKCKLK